MVAAATIFALTGPAPSASAETTSASAGTPYLVTFASGTTAEEQAAAVSDAGATAVSIIPQLRMHQVDVPADSSAAVLDTLRSNSSVVRVEAEKSRTAEGAPDDSAYGEQWSLPQIGWDQAYGTVAPKGSAVVAVLDTGVDASHSDLAGNVVAGASMIEGSSASSDSNGHGTAMAGIVAAETNNGAGIAGVGYAGVKVMPVTVLGADGSGQDGDIINGVVYAADQGADVILMAFSNPGYSPSLQAAVDYAWSRGAVLVGAVGNDGSSTATFPAGDSGVVGVSNTTQSDTLNSSSNYGADTFIAAPGTGILTTSAGGGYGSITGTSASAAEVAGAAALLKANDPGASNGTIVGRLARNADPAGTTAQTGNGRLNLGRAVTDAATGAVKPAGAAPVGSGGPFVGPYVAAAQFSVALLGQPKNTTNWVAGNVSGWSELDAIPMRLELKDGAGSKQITLNFDHTNNNGQVGIQDLYGWNASSGASFTTPVLTWSPASQVWSYKFTVTSSTTTTSYINFNARLGAGAHYFTGSSLAVGDNTVGGNLQVAKPGAAAGNPDMSVSKAGPTTAAPGATVTYTLNYANTSEMARGVQLTDTLPSGVTYVAGSCSNTCSVVGNTVTWDLGDLAVGASGTRTLQVKLPTGVANGTSYTDTAAIQSSQNDKTPGNNTSSLTTTIGFNSGPNANGDSKSTNEDQQLSFPASDLTANDTDPDGDNLTVTGVSGATNGAVSLAGGNVTFTPTADYNGSASFNYAVSDGKGGTANGTVNVTVNPVNDAPSATGGSIEVLRNSTGNSIPVSGSDLETAAGALTYTVTQQPSNGTLSGSGTNLTYTPAAGFVGNDTIKYTVTDTGDPAGCTGSAPACSAAQTSAPATVTIHVDGATTTTSPENASAAYGDSSKTLTAKVTTASGTVNSGKVTFTVKDGATVIGSATSGTVTDGTASVNYALPAGTPAKQYTIVADYSGTSLADSSGNSSLTITARALTITAKDATKTYGSVVTFDGSEFTADGLQGQDTVKSVALVSDGAPAGAAAGTYAIVASGAEGSGLGNYDITYVDGELTVAKKALIVKAESKTRQYSDPTPAFTVTYSGFVNGEGPGSLGGSLALSTNATADSIAGSYDVTPSGLTSSNYAITFTKGTLTVAKEDTSIEYTGDTLVSTGSTSSTSSASLKLSALVTEAADGTLGSRLGSTSVKFSIYKFTDTGMTTAVKTCTAPVSVTSAGKGTAGCTVTSVGADNYIVKAELVTNGWYATSVANAAATVTVAGTGFTTGGGWLTEPNLGSRSNFGFTVKYLKNGSIQGNSLYIYRKTVAQQSIANPSGGFLPAGQYNWIIKSNSMTGLSQTGGAPCPTNVVCKSTFTGKSNVTAVNRTTGVAYSLGGNRQFQVDVTDRGEPGSSSSTTPDTYAIRVWDGSGTYYQLGTSAAQRALEGGNIQVRP